MANTYSQLYIHIIFAVKSRKCLIPKEHKEAVYKYITGVVQERKHKMIAINGMSDHIHFFVGLSPDKSISDLVQEAKAAATKYIKKQDWMKFEFSWQRGFGAFSYARSKISNVATYIENQEEHHKNRTFREEYLDILQKFEVEYDERYIFDFFED
jgi:putative transposase